MLCDNRRISVTCRDAPSASSDPNGLSHPRLSRSQQGSSTRSVRQRLAVHPAAPGSRSASRPGSRDHRPLFVPGTPAGPAAAPPGTECDKPLPADTAARLRASPGHGAFRESLEAGPVSPRPQPAAESRCPERGEGDAGSPAAPATTPAPPAALCSPSPASRSTSPAARRVAGPWSTPRRFCETKRGGTRQTALPAARYGSPAGEGEPGDRGTRRPPRCPPGPWRAGLPPAPRSAPAGAAGARCRAGLGAGG